MKGLDLNCLNSDVLYPFTARNHLVELVDGTSCRVRRCTACRFHELERRGTITNIEKARSYHEPIRLPPFHAESHRYCQVSLLYTAHHTG